MFIGRENPRRLTISFLMSNEHGLSSFLKIVKGPLNSGWGRQGIDGWGGARINAILGWDVCQVNSGGKSEIIT